MKQGLKFSFFILGEIISNDIINYLYYCKLRRKFQAMVGVRMNQMRYLGGALRKLPPALLNSPPLLSDLHALRTSPEGTRMRRRGLVDPFPPKGSIRQRAMLRNAWQATMECVFYLSSKLFKSTCMIYK